MRIEVYLLILSLRSLLCVAQVCQLCENDAVPANATHDLAPLLQEVGFSLASFTCVQLDFYRKVLVEDDEQCVLLQTHLERVRDLCDCPSSDGSQEVTQGCSLCSKGETVNAPSFDLSEYITDEGITGLPQMDDYTCESLAAHMQSISQDDDQCSHLYSNTTKLQVLCGCSSSTFSDTASQCQLCDSELIETDRVIDDLAKGRIPPGTTCGQLQALVFLTMEPGSNHCSSVHDYLGFYCGCVDDLSYLNADTSTKKKLLAWFPFVSGILSILGSTYILVSILRPWRGWSYVSTKDQFLVGLSFFDLLSSTATSFSTLAIPKYREPGIPSGVYGAMGNDATCTAQGFFVVLGATSVYYNMLLSFYYLLTIRYGWKETRMRRISKYMHLVPVLGIIGAFLSINHIFVGFIVCAIFPPPVGDAYWPAYIYTIQVALALLVSTVNIILVSCSYSATMKRARQWRVSATSNKFAEAARTVSTDEFEVSDELDVTVGQKKERRRSSSTGNKTARERDFFWQSFWYLVALYITFSMTLTVSVIGLSGTMKNINRIPYGLWLYAAMVVNVQGFSNFLVYVRPRVLLWTRTRRKKQLQENSGDSGTTGKQTTSPGNTSKLECSRISIEEFVRKDDKSISITAESCD